ncbi:SMI1 / KNR4 family (SUKH-1) [Streptomyces sp. DI166]|uniref:SMI1/KNR4 family protein n=1 Tax=unclassified Streptomyces TaxID=2593676 RepID=UPI0007F3F133|nr:MULTISPECIES: SMI1/KNR4 family protein [unclassified Streptomyces]SBT92586.1 SMI1 / KNR4 family (SUKH-1) [Streptomyces sp. DI166]
MNVDHADPTELAALRAAFDAERKGAPPLGWKAVRAFEAEHGIVLPEPYRTFVAETADGSPSGPPAYGLLPLVELPVDWAGDGRDRDLGTPFPLTETWIWEEDEDPADDIEERIEQVHNHGSLVLGTDGCAMNWHLVVTGPQRGHIWQVTDVGALPFGAHSGFTGGEPGFAGWVRHWAQNKDWFDAE